MSAPLTDQQQAEQGLNITGYAGKWKHAQEYELNTPRTDDMRLLPYWERVRLTFLELGGEFIGQKYGDRQ